MGSPQEHSKGDSPFGEKPESGADHTAARQLSKQAGELLSKKQELINESALRTEFPAINAMSARAAYYGLQGRLWPSMQQVTATMAESGPIGQAALSRMKALGERGWSFGSLSPADSYVANQAESVLGRLRYSLILGGYNDAVSGKIAHNPLQALGNTIVGISDGADKDIAGKYIHELAHGKYAPGYNAYEASAEARAALKQLPVDLQKLHGQMMVQEEARAISAQVASGLSQEQGLFHLPQMKGVAAYPLETALRKGQLGAMVKDVWPYEGTKILTKSEANAAVQDYLRSSYGEMFKNGRLNPQAERAIAAEIAALPLEAPVGGAARVSAVSADTAFSSSRYFNYLSRGGQALGSLAALVAVSDLRTQFRISTGSGTGRLLSVGSDWAGFEAGTAVGGWVGEAVTQLLVKTNPRLAMVALPLFSLGTGIVSSQIMHETISSPLEQKTKNTVDGWLSK